MTRELWLNAIASYLDPSLDSVLAQHGVMKPKDGFSLTFQLPYSSVSAFDKWDMNVSDDAFLLIRVPENKHETIHKVPWANIQAVSITFVGTNRTNAAELSRRMIMRQL